VKLARYLAVVLVAGALVSSAFAGKPPGQPGNSGSSGASGNPGQPGNSGTSGHQGQAGNSGTSGKPSTPGSSGAQGSPGTALPGPGATLATKARTYGHYCQNQSKEHVTGQTRGTPFSQCVTAMAKLATGQTKDAWAACAPLSRKHFPGQAASPFSRCVVAGTRLLNDLHKP
jgi:hypothetical protein